MFSAPNARATCLLASLLLTWGCEQSARGEGPKGGTPTVRTSREGATEVKRRASRAPLPWASYRGGWERSGRSPFRLPRSAPKVRWRFETGRSVPAQVTLDARGGVYLASLDGFVYALDPKGRRRWRRRVGAEIFAPVQLTRHGLLVGGDDEVLRALRPEDGGTRWRVRAGPCVKLPGFGPDRVRCHVDGAPVTKGPMVYFAADALYAVDGVLGKVRWRQALPAHARAGLALGGDTLVVATQGFAVLAFSRVDGRQLWKARVRAHCDAAPAIVGDRVYVGCDDGVLRAFALRDGAVSFRARARRAIRAAPAVDSTGRVFFASLDGRLRALSREGELLWSFQTQGGIRSAPLVDAHGTVVFGSRDDHLYAVDALTGASLWKVRLGGDVDAEPLAGPDGTIYVGADDGALYALR